MARQLVLETLDLKYGELHKEIRMNVAVLKYDNVDYKPLGIPAEWPAEVIELNNGTVFPPDQREGWVQMTSAEYSAYLEYYRAEYDVYAASLTPDLIIASDKNIFGLNYACVRDEEISITTSTSFSPKVVLTTLSLPTGSYRVDCGYLWQSLSSFEAKVTLDDNVVLFSHKGNKSLNWQPMANYIDIELTEGVHTIALSYRSLLSSSGITSARLSMWRTA